MSNVVLFPERTNIKTLSKAQKLRTIDELKLALAECYTALADASTIDANEISLNDLIGGASQ